MKYYYGMRLRGFSVGCQPMDGLIDHFESENNNYYDILVYDRVLSDDEKRHYSLTALSLSDGIFKPIVSIRDYIRRNHGPFDMNGIRFGLFYVNKFEDHDINFKLEYGVSFMEYLSMALEDIRNTLDTWSGTIEELKSFFKIYADSDGIYRNKHYYVPVNDIKKNYVPFGVIME